MISYSTWYDKIGYRIGEVYQDWIDNCPNKYLLDEVPTVEEYLDSEYESQLGDYEDRKYDEWKERNI